MRGADGDHARGRGRHDSAAQSETPAGLQREPPTAHLADIGGAFYDDTIPGPECTALRGRTAGTAGEKQPAVELLSTAAG